MAKVIRSTLFMVASLAIAVALLYLLFRTSGMKWQAVEVQLSTADRFAFVRLILLFAISCFLSSQKWNLTQKALGTQKMVPRAAAFSLTVIGAAVGLFLPVSISMTVVRSLGSLVHGDVLRRGTVATLFEQAFDFLAICTMLVVSILVWLLHGGATSWILLALATVGATLLAVGPAMKVLRWIALRTLDSSSEKRWMRFVREMQQSGLLQPALGRQLTVLSMVRFFLLVLMAGQVTAAIHSSIPLWHLAAAMPFASFAAVAGITPGGLGVTEFAIANALMVFGTPLLMATQWAIASRLISTAAGLVAAALACLGLLSHKLLRRDEIRVESARADAKIESSAERLTIA